MEKQTEKIKSKASVSQDKDESQDSSQEKSRFLAFSVTTEFDVVQVALFAVGFLFRVAELQHPRAIVFDELFFGKYAGFYIKKTFFYDLNPPLGKMLFGLVGYLCGYTGDFVYENIGKEYDVNVPVWQMRLIPAICGSLVVPLAYQVFIEMRLRQVTAVLASFIIICDNSLHTQSRFMLMESMMQMFNLLSLIGYLKFRKLKNRPFSPAWFSCLAVMGLSWGCSVSTKYGGFFTGMLILALLVRDFWELLDDKSIPDSTMWMHFLSRLALVVILPVMLYVGLFYIHFALLTKSGVYDGNMSSKFQASLEGGLAAITKGQPQHIAFGSQITIRHSYGKPCWLHSHGFNYPKFYEGKRGSSQQQQVTCYNFKDPNNWWVVKHPDKDDLNVEDPPLHVKHGDIVQLIHGKTGRYLNSHDVGAPVSNHHQEVSCYIDYNFTNGRVPPQNWWKVDIINRDSEGDSWKIITSQVRLIHLNTTQGLKTTGKILPEWGFSQQEVVTDSNTGQDTSVWNAEEHRYTKSGESAEKASNVGNLIPTEPTYVSFWDKFKELQVKMLYTRHDADLDHRYGSTPLDWPLLYKNVAYWAASNVKRQIHLLGNPLLYCTGTLALLVYCTVLGFYLLRRQRDIYDLPDGIWQQFVLIGELLLGGFLVNFLPYFMQDRTMFLHHYLPAVLFKFMLLAAVMDHIYSILDYFTQNKRFANQISRYAFIVAVVLWCVAVAQQFEKYRVLNQGTTILKPHVLEKLQWRESWDFVYSL